MYLNENWQNHAKKIAFTNHFWIIIALSRITFPDAKVVRCQRMASIFSTDSHKIFLSLLWKSILCNPHYTFRLPIAERQTLDCIIKVKFRWRQGAKSSFLANLSIKNMHIAIYDETFAVKRKRCQFGKKFSLLPY